LLSSAKKIKKIKNSNPVNILQTPVPNHKNRRNPVLQSDPELLFCEESIKKNNVPKIENLQVIIKPNIHQTNSPLRQVSILKSFSFRGSNNNPTFSPRENQRYNGRIRPANSPGGTR